MDDPNRNFNLWKMLLVLARRRFFIGGFVVFATIVAVIVALVLPKWYRAKTSILPSQVDQPWGLTGNFMQYTLSSAGFELPIMATPSDVYATMLKSDRIGRALIEDNDLLSYFGLSSMQEGQLYLKDKTRINITGEGVVELYFEDKDPDMAAKIANSYIEHLDQLNREVKASKAGIDKEFIYNRLQSTKAELDSARTRLLTFQTENKAIDLTQQMETALKTASDLKSRRVMLQVSLDMKKMLYSSGHPEIVKLEREISELDRQIFAIENGSKTDTSFFGVALRDMPQLAVQYAELHAEMDLQTKIYEMLTSMYEEARIKEQKDTPTISILEYAYPPEIRYKPQRSMLVAMTFFGSLCLAIFIALFADYLERLRRYSPADYELLNEARKEITGKTGFSDS